MGFRLEPGDAYRRAEGAAQPLVPTPEDLFDLGHALEVEVAVGAEEVAGVGRAQRGQVGRRLEGGGLEGEMVLDQVAAGEGAAAVHTYVAANLTTC